VATALFHHGVRFRELETMIRAMVTADSAIAFVVGSAPVWQVPGGSENVNKVVMCYSLAEARAAFGEGKDWNIYTLEEHIRSTFINFNGGPVFLVNVVDPSTGATNVPAPADGYTVTAHRVTLPGVNAIFDSVAITYEDEDEDEQTAHYGTDYTMQYDSAGALVITLLAGGALAQETNLDATFRRTTPRRPTEAEIIGDYDVINDKYTGLQLIDTVFSKFRVNPNFVCAPGFSQAPTVAAAMTAKSYEINTVFTGKALIDANTTTVRAYSAVPEYKNQNSLFDVRQDFFWPMVRLGNEIYHASTIYACLCMKTDVANGGIPFESPSNKIIPADGACLADGTPIDLTLRGANYLNANGVKTLLNFIGGWRMWGDWSAAFPANTDPKDMFSSVKRMMDYVGNSTVLTTWQFVGKPILRRLVEQTTDTLQLWVNHLVARSALMYGRILFPRALNPDTELIAGHITFAVNITPPPPAVDIEFLISFDLAGLATLFGGEA
jgi:phage tail sheath protein FI